MHTLKSLIETIATLRERLGAIAQNTQDPSAGSWLVSRLAEIEQEIAALDLAHLSAYQLEDFADALSDMEAELKVQFSADLQVTREVAPRTFASPRSFEATERPNRRRGNRR